MKKTLIPLLAVAMAGLLVSCGGTSGTTVANKDKPLVWFNRQPSDPETGKIDSAAMTFNDFTYYSGFDAAAGGAVQGKLITDYLATQTAALDRNGDGKIGYVLAIGDIAHNDSKARTKGIRQALGTWDTTAADGYAPSAKKAGSVKVGTTDYVVEELAAQEMKSTAGATWDAATAGDALDTWVNSLGTKIDMIISNNDGMAMGMLGKNSCPVVPVFGYDANPDAVDSVKVTTGKHLTGTVSQNVGAQAALTLQILRNGFDGETGANVYKKGISEADKWGNKITPTIAYVEADRALLAANSAVTAANADQYVSGSWDSGIKQISGEKKNVLITLYNAGDTFLSGSYKPALEHYATLLNITLTWAEGDGQSEQGCLDKFINLGKYDGYAINLVRTNNAASYTNLLNK
jgi:methyl-galactoside transport system substrate-binding protein